MSYNPAAIAVAGEQTQRFVRTLSQRDLSLVVPVNFVTYPGVVLSAACFAHGQYDVDTASKCFSNLLAVGFRRIEADIYWDAGQAKWSLCPAELGGDGDGDGDGQEVLTTSTSIPTTPLQTSTQLSANFITERETPTAVHPLEYVDRLVLRQTDSEPPSPSSFSSTAASATTTTIASEANQGNTPITPTSTGSPAIDDYEPVPVGPYTCSAAADLLLLVNVLSTYFENTGNKLNATTVMLTLNLHTAASASAPTGSAPQSSPDDLPANRSLSNAITPGLSVYLYTPEQLLQERSSLNVSESWFGLYAAAQPDDSYFEVNVTNNRWSTQDGWPSESFIELAQSQRLLVAFGTIDPQIRDYDTAGDAAIIFPSDYLAAPRVTSTTSTGNITSGCFFNPEDTSVTSQNSSWAISTIGNGTIAAGAALQSLLSEASNLTFCGISPILNSTLDNITADRSPDIYTAFVQSTVWSWGLSEPVNASSSADLQDYHCAAMNSTTGYWQASNCGSAHRGACRIGDAPYDWEISNSGESYARIDYSCGNGTAFDTPRNSLENAHLLSVWRSWRADRRDDGDDDDDDDDDDTPLLWLNFNDLDLDTCWVIGQNATCPYTDNVLNAAKREIIVPVVGGVVVFVLAALTVLVKCAGNRQQTKRRRRRGEDGWDYEGVPS